MIVLDDVLNKEELHFIYRKCVHEPSWYLSRPTKLGVENGDEHTFGGLLIRDGRIGQQMHKEHFSKESRSEIYEYMLENVLPRVKKRCLEEYNLEIPSQTIRFDVVAKTPGCNAEMHKDIDFLGGISIVGMLSPEWEKECGGEFSWEDDESKTTKILDWKPGRFLVFNSEIFHRGVGSKTSTKYWRLITNFILVPEHYTVDMG